MTRLKRNTYGVYSRFSKSNFKYTDLKRTAYILHQVAITGSHMSYFNTCTRFLECYFCTCVKTKPLHTFMQELLVVLVALN